MNGNYQPTDKKYDFNNVKVVFFMIVTDRDIVIADFAVRSYTKIQGAPFKLLIYSNWITSTLKQRYFPRWRQFAYVEIVENDWQTDEQKPMDRRLWGPFELGYTIWDRELKRITAPYVATVDADFEILDGAFINIILEQFGLDHNLAVFSSDYSPKRDAVWDSYSNEVICLNERWHTWFCVYRREVLNVPVSHAYYEEVVAGPIRRNAWDDAGYLQKYIKQVLGYRLAALGSAYQECFIHYGQFSHNKDIDETNVRLYRRLKILRKAGFLGRCDVLTRGIATVLDNVLYGYVDRSKYWEGWAQAVVQENTP
jgi:hypothetical protein